MMMKTTEHGIRWVFLPVLCALLLAPPAGCGAAKQQGYADYEYERISEAAAERAVAETGFRTEDNASPQTESSASSAAVSGKTRKLIRSADLSIEADNSLIGEDGSVGAAAQKLEEMAGRHNGYIEQSRADASSFHCTVRVPAASFDEFLSGMSALGKIISRSENAEDVTVKYYDLEGRLATKKNLLATFQSYLGRAKNIEEIMQIETRIADLQNEIDWLGTQLTELSNLADYSTVSLYLFNPREVHSYTLGDRILKLFGSFGDFASAAVLVILGIVIFGIPVLFLVILLYWLLIGKIGLLKKAFRLASGANKSTVSKGE
jgi:hypothetical protein